MRVPLSRRIETLVGSGPRKGFLALLAGAGIGQGLAVLTSPILSRLYTPSAFGVFTYVVAVSSVLAVGASLRLEFAIPITSDAHEARNLVRAGLASSLLVGAISAVVIACFNSTLSHFAGFEFLPWGWWLPPITIVTAWFSVLSMAALRKRNYGAVANRTVIQGIGTAVCQLGGAAITRSPGGLLTGQFFGRSLGLASLARANKELLVRSDGPGTSSTLRRYWRFPAVFAPSALINTLGANLPLLLVATWYGTQSAGALGLTLRITAVPAAIVGVAAGQVFSAEISARVRAGQIDNRSLYIRTSRKLSILGLPMAAALLLMGPTVFPFVFGQRWSDSGAFAQAMALVVGLGFVVGPVSFVYLAYEKAGRLLGLDVLRVALIVGAGYACYSAGQSALTSLWAMAAAQAAQLVITWLVGLKIVSSAGPQVDIGEGGFLVDDPMPRSVS